MKNLKYLIIILVLSFSIITGCKHKLNDGMIHITGRVVTHGTDTGVEGVPIYLLTKDYNQYPTSSQTVANVYSEANGFYHISAVKNNDLYYTIQYGIIMNIDVRLFDPREGVYNDIILQY
ncbi:MAG: hypothetical protein SGJ10_00975 [Bacteroidota bacterium]|nr:hypothetical protein [Bacteroidota bacterium]